VLAAGTAVGAAASGGSVAGGATAFNATANNYLTTVDLSKANRTKSIDIKTSLANNDKLIDACQGGASPACTQAQSKVQQDIQDLQDYKIALLSERNLSNDSATKEAISARIKEADAQIASANNQLETARLQTNGGNYFTKDLTGAQRETIGMALDPLQAAGVKAGIKVVDTVTTVIDNAAVSAEQAAAVSRMKVENNATKDSSSNDNSLWVSKQPQIQTPYGPALQSGDAKAVEAAGKINEGAPVYRIGTVGKSETAEAQFWSLENPLTTPNYAEKYGIPQKNIDNANFIERGTVTPGVPFVTRPAPGVGKNGGGEIEIVVPPSGVQLNSFSIGSEITKK
jgi:hypothetical protein